MAERIASLYAEIGADTKKLEAGLNSAEGELKSFAGVTNKAAQATDLASASNTNFAKTAGISNRTANILTGSFSNLVGEVLEDYSATVILTGALFAVSQAFQFAAKAAEEFGNTKVKAQTDSMTDGVNSLKKAILDIPIGGMTLLEFLGQAAEGLGNVARLTGVVVAATELYVGAINEAQFVTQVENIANAEKIKTLQALKGEITDVASATELLRAANRKNFDDYQAQKQAGYIAYAIQRGADAGISKLPGRAATGPVVGGMSYAVGERRAEIFTPAVSGNVSNAAGGGSISNVSVQVSAGAFLGNRNDAIRLGQALAPIIKQAMSRNV